MPARGAWVRESSRVSLSKRRSLQKAILKRRTEERERQKVREEEIKRRLAEKLQQEEEAKKEQENRKENQETQEKDKEKEKEGPKRMTEEERQGKIDELDKRKALVEDQKHELFLLLKKVLMVDEKKKKKQAEEEERIRAEEQRRAEEALRSAQFKAIREAKSMEDKDEGFGGTRSHGFHSFSSGANMRSSGGGRGESHYLNKPRFHQGGRGMHRGGPAGGNKLPYHSRKRHNLGPVLYKPDRNTPPLSPPAPPMNIAHPQPRRGPPGLFPFGVQTVPTFALPPEAFAQQVPHIPSHLPMPPMQMPMGMMPGMSLGHPQMPIHPFPPHMMTRPGLLPTPPTHHRGGRGRGNDRRRRGGFWG